MSQGKDWNTFLQSGENKTELINYLADYYVSESVKLDIQLVSAESNNTWWITSDECCTSLRAMQPP